MLSIFSSPPFYTKYIQLPKAGYRLPRHFHHNPKLYPYFKDALGAIDGSHIHCAPPSIERVFYRNRKGFISQNCFFACSFSLHFVYSLCGWEGSATDSRIWEDAYLKGFVVPEGRYYLADAGFLSCKELLILYKAVRYHLAEWGRANVR
jgi:DDE superfamily endonuclease